MKLIILATALTIGAGAGAFAADAEKPGATFGRKVENTFRNWKLEELPLKVQKTVRDQSFGHKIKDIDREDRSGRTLWEIRFDGGPHGEARLVHSDNDGSIVNGEGKLLIAGTPAKGETGAGTSVPASPPPPKGAPEGQNGKIKKKWSEVPEAVKKASAKYGTPDYIRDIDVEKRDGMMVWELEFSREGQNIELHFGEDGRVLEHIDSGNKKAPQP